MRNARLIQHCRSNWEVFFLVFIWGLLVFQLYFLKTDHSHVADLHVLVKRYFDLANFMITSYGPPFMVVQFTLLSIAFLKGAPSRLSCGIYDAFGMYYILRMLVQFVGLNILVFDASSSRFLLITQLIFFLPYSLLIWGWIYWRLDRFGRSHGQALFKLDHERELPRVIDFFVASFSSVFSASISNIKGTCARSRILILLHGVMIYDLMGLTLSRAVALVQR